MAPGTFLFNIKYCCLLAFPPLFYLTFPLLLFLTFHVVEHWRSPHAKCKVPVAKPNVAVSGEESNAFSGEEDDEYSSEEYNGKTEEEDNKSTDNVAGKEDESEGSDEEEVDDKSMGDAEKTVDDDDQGPTLSTPLQSQVSGEDYDTPIMQLPANKSVLQAKARQERERDLKAQGLLEKVVLQVGQKVLVPCRRSRGRWYEQSLLE
jgi:hypothetical protein